MRFETTAGVPHPVDEVYPCYRDDFSALATDVQNIEGVEVRARHAQQDGVVTEQAWRGRGWIPRVARRLLAPPMLRWDAQVRWYDAERRCAWSITPHFFGECVDCSGEVAWHDGGDGRRTRMVMSGNLRITLDSIAAVPRLLRRPLARRTERFLLGMVPRNFAGVARRANDALRYRVERRSA